MRALDETPASGRRKTLLWTLEAVAAIRYCHIVEVGTARDPHGLEGDGWSTRVWAWYVDKYGGSVVSIDTSLDALAQAHEICGPRGDVPQFVHGKAEDVLGSFKTIDLLYLDGSPDAASHLSMYYALTVHPEFVLFDDILDPITFDVKGSAAIPIMKQDGYSVVFVEGRQALLRYDG